MAHTPKEDPITYFGQTDSRGRRTPFGIRASDRSRHMYVIGKTGMGKSTLLENLAIQDIKNGNGVCFVDPHGKTAELLLEYVPENRIKDVLYFAPFDLDHPVAFNIMEDVGADKRHLVVNGLMATFEKIWVDAWSARMAYILQNTLLALLEYPDSTLLGVNRMLVDKEYRKLVVNNITDPSCRSFWVDEFAKYTDRYTQEATPAIQNKVGQFTGNPLIRNIVGQGKSNFNLRKLMDEGKILIVNLSKGKVGEGNANLLGSMLITKIYLAAMSRADVDERELQKLPNFYLHVDEFQSFANKSFADILSEARKYKLNLTLAHQYVEQMEEEVRSAVFGNVGTMIVFRVGAYDAELLEKEFAPAITAEDLVNLGIYQVYLKLMINGVTSQPFSATTLPPIEHQAESFKERVIEFSRSTYARPRSIVEEEIRLWHEPILPPPKEVKKDGPVERVPLDKIPRSGPPQGSGPRPRDFLQRPSSSVSGPVPPVGGIQAREATPRPFSAPKRDMGTPVSPSLPSSLSSTAPYPSPSLPRSESRRDTLSPQGQAGAPISLSELRGGIKKERVDGAHLSELRKALSDVLKSSGATEGDTTPEPKRVPILSPSSSHPPAGTQASRPASVAPTPASSRPPTSPREIPEDELRQLLKVDPPEVREK